MSNLIRILITDDHVVVRRGTQALLATEPEIEVVGEAKNGEEAVAKALQLQPDVILMDLEMPVMDGYEFLKTVKQDRRYQSIPVIMLTSVSQKEKVIEAVRIGAKQYITKPFSGEDVLAKIIQAVGMENLGDL